MDNCGKIYEKIQTSLQISTGVEHLYHQTFPSCAAPTYLHQLLLLLSECARILRHCLQVPLGACSFESP